MHENVVIMERYKSRHFICHFIVFLLLIMSVIKERCMVIKFINWFATGILCD